MRIDSSQDKEQCSLKSPRTYITIANEFRSEKSMRSSWQVLDLYINMLERSDKFMRRVASHKPSIHSTFDRDMPLVGFGSSSKARIDRSLDRRKVFSHKT